MFRVGDDSDQLGLQPHTIVSYQRSSAPAVFIRPLIVVLTKEGVFACKGWFANVVTKHKEEDEDLLLKNRAITVYGALFFELESRMEFLDPSVTKISRQRCSNCVE